MSTVAIKPRQLVLKPYQKAMSAAFYVLGAIITIVGMNMASLVCGSFIIESVFGWPGIGTFAMEAIGKRDYPIIMA